MRTPSSLTRLFYALLTALTLAPVSGASAIHGTVSPDRRYALETPLPPMRLRGGRALVLPALRFVTIAATNPAYAKVQLWVIQAAGRIEADWRTALEAKGARIIAYLPENAYVIAIDAAGAASLASLAQKHDGPHARTGGLAPLPADARIDASIAQSIASGAQSIAATAQFPDTPAGRAAGLAWYDRIKALEGAPLTGAQILASFVTFSFNAPPASLALLREDPLLFNLEPYVAPTRTDERQAQLLAGNIAAGGNTPSGPGYLEWLLSMGFTTTASAYPVIDIVDDGVDLGDPQNVAVADLHELGDPARLGRMTYARNCTSDASAANTSGHGTLNAGIAVGYALTSAGADNAGYSLGLGIAPFARFGATKIIRNTGVADRSGCGGTDAAIVAGAHALGAQITLNSWAAGNGGAYTAQSQAYDALTRDADPNTPGDQPMLHIFAAGNSATGLPSSVAAPGTAKNVISVGATENARDPNVVDGCNVSAGDSANDIATFSARGYTADGRAKPDLVAPGTHVQGPVASGSGFTGAGVCGARFNNGSPPADDAYYPPGQSRYTWSSGSSHAAPAIAGAAALIAEHYSRTAQLGAWPSPALARAILINSTRYLTGASANDDLPGAGQGWGAPNLRLAFDDTSRVRIDQTHRFTASGQMNALNGYVADPGRPVRVTLAWTDAPGNPIGGAYVNDLDLEVAVGGQTYQGNFFSGGASATGGSPDAINSVESVFLPAGLSGPLSIRVIASNIVGDGVPSAPDSLDQDYALVVYNIDDSFGVLAVSVKDVAGGAGIAGASINLFDAAGSPVNPGATGPFGEASLFASAGAYTVAVSAPGYVSMTVSGVAIAPNLTTTLGVSLTTLPRATLSGFTRDGAHGYPLQASVTAVSADVTRTTWSDAATGFYSLTLPNGPDVRVAAVAGLPGYQPAAATVDLTASSTRDLVLAPNVDCAPAGYVANFYGVFETFSATTTPSGWTVVDTSGGGAWVFSDPGGRSNLTGGTGGMASVDSDTYGNGKTQDTELRTPALNFSTEPEVFLRFRTDFRWYETAPNEIADIDISQNGASGPWVNVWRRTESYRGPIEETIDVSAVAGGRSNIMARFRYYNASFDWWWQVDDVRFGHTDCAAVNGGIVTGRVVGAGDGALINGAALSPSIGISVTSGAGLPPGQYAVFLPSGTHTLTAIGPGAVGRASAVIVVTSGSVVTRDFVLPAPGLAITPDRYEITLTQGNSTTASLWVTNTGPLTLTWQAYESSVGQSAFDPLYRNSDIPAPAFGGPDAGGYYWTSSDEPGGPTFAWVDTSSGQSFTLGDDTEANISLPFPIGFYTLTTQSLRIGNNGALLVGATAGDVDFQNLDLANAPSFFVSPFWDDLDAGGTVRWMTIGAAPNRAAVIEWRDIPRYTTAGPIGAATFQVLLFEDGGVVFQYADVSFGIGAYDDGASASVGIRGLSPAQSLQFSRDSASLGPNLAIRFSRGGRPDLAPWLTTQPLSSTGQMGGAVISLTFDAGQITQPGIYTATLTVDSNAPSPQREAALTMTVLPLATQGLLRIAAQTLGACDIQPAPLGGAQIGIAGPAPFSASLRADDAGAAARWLTAGVYSVTVMAPGALSATVVATVTAANAVTAQVGLRAALPCAALAPATLQITTTLNVVTTTARLTNTGASALTWTLVEGSSPLCSASIPWLSAPPTGTLAAGASAGQAIVVDGRGLLRGRYDAWLCALTNDALHPNLPIAITVWSDAQSRYLPVVRRP
ncbi:MAG TPA: S8 family serine peptidase [Thermoflexales bacterium]|nr:S8 family serine peptidase [Thermoflexales bacterium]